MDTGGLILTAPDSADTSCGNRPRPGHSSEHTVGVQALIKWITLDARRVNEHKALIVLFYIAIIIIRATLRIAKIVPAMESHQKRLTVPRIIRPGVQANLIAII